MTLSEEFENMITDESNMFKEVDDINIGSNEDGYLNHLADREIIQLKNNTFPKGLVPLVQLFDHNDVAKNPGTVPNDG